MSLADKLREQRRLLILQALQEDDSRRLSDTALCIVLSHLAWRTESDVLRADLVWLCDQALIRIEKLDDGRDLWIAELSQEGERVLGGRPHPGVTRVKSR